ncbi:hypothetical protein MBLNU230_g0296t1 [Neophaeotheca triangularis]
MSNFLPHKSRRPKFAFHLHIHDLNNVPLVSGSSFIKWHLPASTAAEHRGRTPKAQIRDHRVVYDCQKDLTVRLQVGKEGLLQPVEVVFEVVQEYSSSGRGERIVLGRVRVNLAEYVGVSEEGGSSGGGGGNGGEGESGGGGGGFGVTRRYLMQESKINSTLKIGLGLRHVEGTKEYSAPPLRSAQVFGGIAGIVSSAGEAVGAGGNSHSQGEEGGAGSGNGGQGTLDSMPSLGNRKGELEMQDLYRRTLAAYWSSQPGEMKADECIEDIFAGGDGWGKGGRPPDEKMQPSSSGGSGASTPRVDRDVGEADRSPRHHHHHHHHHHHRHRSSWRSPLIQKDGVNERGSLERRPAGYKQRGDMAPRKAPGEVDEFDIREDLRSWRIGEAAHG